MRRHQREVGPLSRGVISPEGSTPIRPATGRPSLPPSSSTRRPLGPPYGGPTPKGGRRAYHVPRTYQGWFRLCLFAGGSTAAAGEGEYPCTGPLTFWSKPLSAFGLLVLTTFISSSPGLAMPSTLAPDRLSASSRRALSREARPPWVGEVTLSQELRTARLPRPHVLVGYQWSHTGLRPGRKTSHNRYIRSFVSHPPQIRACTSRAPGSSSHEFATRAIRCRYVDMVQVTMYLPGFSSTAHETAPPSLDGVPRVGSPASTVL